MLQSRSQLCVRELMLPMRSSASGALAGEWLLKMTEKIPALTEGVA